LSYEGGEIVVSQAESIDRPLRLRVDEASALLVALRMLAEVPSLEDRSALSRTIAKLEVAAGAAGAVSAQVAVQVDDHAAGSMLDVMVAPALAPRVLRGACSLAWAGHRCAVAWGFLPACPGLSVWFTRGAAHAHCFAASVSVIAGSFWVAPAQGRFRAVTVEHGGGRDRCRVRAARPC